MNMMMIMRDPFSSSVPCCMQASLYIHYAWQLPWRNIFNIINTPTAELKSPSKDLSCCKGEGYPFVQLFVFSFPCKHHVQFYTQYKTLFCFEINSQGYILKSSSRRAGKAVSWAVVPA